jgi:hypothetical protein
MSSDVVQGRVMKEQIPTIMARHDGRDLGAVISWGPFRFLYEQMAVPSIS